MVVSPRVDCLTLEDGTNRLSRNIGNYQSALLNIPEERRTLIQFTISINNRPNYTGMFITAVIKEKYQSITN
jgi:hypothetical protein